MRCTTCGTENEPNSRFCGGCGARQPASGEQRLAPTAKISDDAPYPQQPSARPAVAPQGPVSYAPPSIPPQSVAAPKMSAPVLATPAPGSLSTPPPGSLARPQSQNPASAPPTARATPARPVTRPQLSSGSESITVPARRPIGLMVALLILDIGLAAAGGVLLSKGLAERETKKTDTAPVEKKSEAPASATGPASDKVAASAAAPAAASAAAPATAPATAPAAAPVAARESPKRAGEPSVATATTTAAKAADTKTATKPADTKTAAKPADTKTAAKPADTKTTAKPADTKTTTKPADTKATDTKTTTKPTDKPDEAKPVGSVPTTQPQDPYNPPNTEREIDAAAASSKSAFAQCASDHPGHGSIKVAFQVRADGRVINASAVENTTGNADLARCLTSEISSWRVTAHNGAAINMLRPFTYP